MKLKLVTAPQPVLSQPAKEVERVDKKTLAIVEDMKETLLSCSNPVGVGLAAPQVGIPLQIFLVKPVTTDKIQVFINPKIVKIEGKGKKSQNEPLEGCLSVNNVWAHVKRATKVVLEYTQINGKRVTKEFSGEEAQIIQHEFDHLQGILFTQRAIQQGEDFYRIEKIKGKERLVPIEI